MRCSFPHGSSKVFKFLYVIPSWERRKRRFYNKGKERDLRWLYTPSKYVQFTILAFIVQEINKALRGFLSLYCYFSQIYDTYSLTKCQAELPRMSPLVWKRSLSAVIGVFILSFVILHWCLREKFGPRSPLQIQRCDQGHSGRTDARCYRGLNEASVLN